MMGVVFAVVICLQGPAGCSVVRGPYATLAECHRAQASLENLRSFGKIVTRIGCVKRPAPTWAPAE